MDNTIKCNTEHWVYTGVKLKNYLQRSDLSYKDAAEELGIDKNTVGKAVRGGNLNIDIILRICNTYGLNIYDFFEQVDLDNSDSVTDHYFSSDDELSATSISAEPDLIYKKSKKSDSQVEDFSRELEQMQLLVTELSEKLNNSYKILDELKAAKNPDDEK